jgi:hypothetical protein
MVRVYALHVGLGPDPKPEAYGLCVACAAGLKFAMDCSRHTNTLSELSPTRCMRIVLSLTAVHALEWTRAHGYLPDV